MNKTTIIGSIAAAVLVLALGYQAYVVYSLQATVARLAPVVAQDDNVLHQVVSFLEKVSSASSTPKQ